MQEKKLRLKWQKKKELQLIILEGKSLEGKQLNMEQNVERKFNSRQNQVRHYILEFTVNEGRAFNLEEDKAGVL